MTVKPFRILSLVCALQVLLWTLGPALVSTSPPLDVVEGYLWGREWQLLTYKHPQLPGWFLETGRLLGGSVLWPNYLISQLFVAATFILVYLFGRDIAGRRLALPGALLMPALYYCEWVTQQFNHDIAQLPFWAAIVFLLWRAVERNKAGWWLLLGLVSGIGLYAKFSTGVVIGFGGLWLLLDAKARTRLSGPWPWLGLAVFLLVAAPLGQALWADQFLPFHYAADRTEWVTENRSTLYFLLVQLAAHAALAVVVVLVGLVPIRRRVAAEAPVPDAIEPRAIRYLLLMGLGPALSIVLASFFTGVGEAWATPMFNLSGLIVVVLMRRHLTDSVLRRIMVAAPVCVVIWSMSYCASVVIAEVKGRHMSTVLMPQAEMSRRMEAVWRTATGKPLRIVAGNDLSAMVAALSVTSVPSYFTDFNMTYAPWITPERIAREGMLVIWRGEPPADAKPWISGLPVGQESFSWSHAAGAAPLVLDYAIVPPKG